MRRPAVLWASRGCDEPQMLDVRLLALTRELVVRREHGRERVQYVDPGLLARVSLAEGAGHLEYLSDDPAILVGLVVGDRELNGCSHAEIVAPARVHLSSAGWGMGSHDFRLVLSAVGHLDSAAPGRPRRLEDDVALTISATSNHELAKRASRGRRSGMRGHVRASRQPDALAASESTVRPRTSVCLIADASLTVSSRSQLAQFRVHPAVCLIADANLTISSRSQLAQLRVHPVMRLIEDARLTSSARSRPAQQRAHPILYLSASTRALRARVHPHATCRATTLPPTPASRPPVARAACIEESPSARNACPQPCRSAPKACIANSLPRTRQMGACIPPPNFHDRLTIPKETA
jgi:hypothetical protein